MKKIAILVAAVAAAFGIKKLLGRRSAEPTASAADVQGNGYIPHTST